MNELIPPASWAHPSARMRFQLKYVEMYLTFNPTMISKIRGDAEPRILNIGCSDDPVGLGDEALHFDMDDWSGVHKHFCQGDAHELPFEDETFHLILMGDIHEHLYDPLKATLEACRVLSPNGILVMSIFEEWRLPGQGQHIEYSAKLNHPVDDSRVKYFDNDDVPHLYHINQFNDADIWNMMQEVCTRTGYMRLHEFSKSFETVHEGHPCFNWLVALRRAE